MLAAVVCMAVFIAAFGEQEGIDEGLKDAAGQESLAKQAVQQLDRACSKLSKSLVDNFIAQSHSKKSYFLKVQEATGLTAAKRESSIKASLPAAYMIGDSIVRELSESYHRVAPQTKMTYVGYTSPKYWNPTLGEIDNGDPSMIKTMLQKCTEFDVFWIGGNAVHNLGDIGLNGDMSDPLTSHYKVTERNMGIMQCLKVATGARGIYVGAISVEPQVFLKPPKHDWESYPQFGMLEHWARIDTIVTAKAGVQIFDPDTLSRKCPGLRCDGMHFASDFNSFNCSSSAFLWDYVIASYMQHNVSTDQYRERKTCNPTTALEVYEKCMQTKASSTGEDAEQVNE